MGGERASDHGRRSTSASLALYLAFLLALVCALSLSFLPRAIAPNELPALTLPTAEVEAQLHEDARRAARAPTSDSARELERLFVEFGASEIAAIEDPALATQRRRTLHHAFERVVAADGGEAAAALRERALAKFERALASQLPLAEAKGVIGLFANAVEQHRLTRDGEELAPHFVMRTFYKARWNRMTGLPLDYQFSRIERVAYYGWMGLSATNLPFGARRDALTKYAAAAGPHADEALGVLAYLHKDYERSVEALTRARTYDSSLRVRNYLTGARMAAAMFDQQPPVLSDLTHARGAALP